MSCWTRVSKDCIQPPAFADQSGAASHEQAYSTCSLCTLLLTSSLHHFSPLVCDYRSFACTALAVSHDGSVLASLSSSDRSLKVFDVATFDMIGMLRLPFAPSCAEWIYQVLMHPTFISFLQ